MTRETKVGLLIGLGVILLIGIIVSDHLSVVQHQDPARMTTFADQAQESIHPNPRPRDMVIDGTDTAPEPATTVAVDPDEPVIIDNTPAGTPREPIYTPEELDSRHTIDHVELPLQTNPPIAAGIFANADRDLPDDPADGMLDEPVGDNAGIRAAPQRPSYAGGGSIIEEPTTLPEPPARRPGSELIHYVKSGENLYNIAETYYGNGDYWRSIASRNPDTVDEDGRIVEGARLVIPNRSGLIDSGQFSAVATERVVQITTVTPAKPQTIEVESGDTLSVLAHRHLGNSTRWRELLEANRDQIGSPQDLQAGMTLRLPDAPRDPHPAFDTPSTGSRVVEQAPTPDRTYTVKRGDNLTRIAEKTLGDGGRWRDLFEANKHQMANADDVKVGQKLVLPR